MTELLASYPLKSKRLKEKSRDNKSSIPKSPISKRKGRQRLLKAQMFSQFKIRSRGTWEHILLAWLLEAKNLSKSGTIHWEDWKEIFVKWADDTESERLRRE